MSSLCYSVMMQHSIIERILKIDPRVFEFIHYKQKYKSFVFIILIQIYIISKYTLSVFFWNTGCALWRMFVETGMHTVRSFWKRIYYCVKTAWEIDCIIGAIPQIWKGNEISGSDYSSTVFSQKAFMCAHLNTAWSIFFI